MAQNAPEPPPPKQAMTKAEKQKILTDLTSTQCRKRTLTDSTDSYIRYIEQIHEYYALFHTAAN
jgi:hypothetical protein